MTRYVTGVNKTSYPDFMSHWVIMALAIPDAGIVPANASTIKTSESKPCPTSVEPIVLAHSHLPFVAHFIFART